MLRFIGVCKAYPNTLPSDLLNIGDPYTAYCLNEAIAYINQRLINGDKPIFRTHYTKPSDIYKQYENGGV